MRGAFLDPRADESFCWLAGGGRLHYILFGTEDTVLLFCPNEQYG